MHRQHRAQERRVVVGVQEVQRAVAADGLILVDEVERQVERSLVAVADAERRVAAEMHADVAIDLAVHGDARRHVDVGVVEGDELGLPVRILELDEERAQRARVVERRVGEVLHVGRRQAHAGAERRTIAAAASTAAEPAATARCPAARGTPAPPCVRPCSAGRPCPHRTGRRWAFLVPPPGPPPCGPPRGRLALRVRLVRRHGPVGDRTEARRPGSGGSGPRPGRLRAERVRGRFVIVLLHILGNRWPPCRMKRVWHHPNAMLSDPTLDTARPALPTCAGCRLWRCWPRPWRAGTPTCRRASPTRSSGALSQSSSEPGGYFRSADITNLTSNELLVPARDSRSHDARRSRARVYLGVGPEQNFTYMAATKPGMAIIFDIRRGNLDMQLMYKAIFELATDRADFVSMLFRQAAAGRSRPGVDRRGYFTAFARRRPVRRFTDEPSGHQDAADKDARAVRCLQSDLEGIETIYQTFYWSGFYLRSSPSYAEPDDGDRRGRQRAQLPRHRGRLCLAEGSAVPQSRRARRRRLRRTEGHSRDRRLPQGAWRDGVGAFYLSNVEQYLEQDGKWGTFCRNVATLPLDASSTFIRLGRVRRRRRLHQLARCDGGRDARL